MRTCLFIAVELLYAQCPVFGQCKESLAYLSSKIPAVQDQRLTKVRDSILSTKIADVIRQIREQGMSLREEAEKMFAQAGQFDDSMSVSANAIRQMATGAYSLLAKAEGPRLRRHDASPPKSTESLNPILWRVCCRDRQPELDLS